MSNSQSSQPVHRRTSSRGKSSSIQFLRNINCNFNMLKAQLFSRNIEIKLQLCQRRLDQSGDGATVDPRDTPLPRHRLWQNGHIQLLNRRISRSQRLLAQGLCVVALVFSFLAGFFNSESHREMASQSLQIVRYMSLCQLRCTQDGQIVQPSDRIRVSVGALTIRNVFPPITLLTS